METLEIKVPDKQAAKRLLMELKKRSDVASVRVLPATIDEVTLASETSLAKDWLSPEDDHWDDVYNELCTGRAI